MVPTRPSSSSPEPAGTDGTRLPRSTSPAGGRSRNAVTRNAIPMNATVAASTVVTTRGVPTHSTAAATAPISSVATRASTCAPSVAPAEAPSTFPASYAAFPSTTAPSTSSSTSRPLAPPRKRSRMASARLRPETIVTRALASCSTTVAMVEKVSAHSSAYPNPAPADAHVVTVPGPMNAAGITDQKRICRMRFMRRGGWGRARASSTDTLAENVNASVPAVRTVGASLPPVVRPTNGANECAGMAQGQH